MIHWLWLIPVFSLGVWAGYASRKSFAAGTTLGVIGTLLVLLGIT